MIKRLIEIFAYTTIVGLAIQTASAQFPINIPKIGKPKATPSPSTGSTATGIPTETGRATAAARSGGPYAVKPEPPMEPQFLPESMGVQIERWDYYWKIPNDNRNTSWVPRIRFDVFYGGTARQRYKAEYSMPDGTPWFSEALEFQVGYESEGTSQVSSASESGRDKKAIVTGGVFGIKIINMRDNSTAFQGKFKVVRYKPQYSDARYKNEVDYYVDYDWKLPIAMADIYWERNVASPTLRMWFKGDLKIDGFEARLFQNGKQIATTDDGGGVGSGERFYADKRGEDESLFWREVTFSWPKRAEFIVTEDVRTFTAYKDTMFINQMPGEYVVKIFYNGDQVRETKFSIGGNGTYADNSIAKRSNLTTRAMIIPVQVMGTLDKWNPTNAKAMGFYGNPVIGIQ